METQYRNLSVGRERIFTAMLMLKTYDGISELVRGSYIAGVPSVQTWPDRGISIPEIDGKANEKNAIEGIVSHYPCKERIHVVREDNK